MREGGKVGSVRAMRQEVSYLNAPDEWTRNRDTGELVDVPFCSDNDVGIYFRPEVRVCVREWVSE